MAGSLEERRQWLTQAAEQAEKARVHAESEVQAAKKSLASENDIRVGSREVRCSLRGTGGHTSTLELNRCSVKERPPTAGAAAQTLSN